MTGSLQIKNNKYYAVINVYDSSGKRKVKWFSTGFEVKSNKRRAEQYLQDKIRELEELAAEPHCEMQFTEWIKIWLENKAKTVEDITYESYVDITEHHVYPYFSERRTRLCDISIEYLQEYFDYKYKYGRLDGEGGLSPRYIRYMKNIIFQSLNAAVKDDLISKNYCAFVTLPKKVKREYTFYTEEQINDMLLAIRDEQLYALIKFTCIYGLRRSEVLGLRWNSVDLSRNLITINHTVVSYKTRIEKNRTKNASSYRSFPLLPEIREMLIEMKANEKKNRMLFKSEYKDNDFVFKWDDGTPYRPDYITAKFRKMLEKYNLPHIRFHDLRHSCASLLISRGFGLKDVQEWLGHSDISVTANTYSHIDVKRKQSIANAIGESVKC